MQLSFLECSSSASRRITEIDSGTPPGSGFQGNPGFALSPRAVLRRIAITTTTGALPLHDPGGIADVSPGVEDPGNDGFRSETTLEGSQN